MGHPTLPTAVKRARGTLRKSRINDAEPQFSLTIPLEPPPNLDSLAKKHWIRHAEILAKAGTLTEADYSALQAASERWSVYWDATLEMRKTKILKEYEAYNRIATSSFMTYWAIMREFGVGAASRTRIRVDKPQEKADFEDFEVA